MKTICTLLAILTLTTASAQNAETVDYEVNTDQLIQSLRLTVIKDHETTTLPYAIGDLGDSTVCLQLSPSLDYELLVNNSTLIYISSSDIEQSIDAQNENSPISLITIQSWAIRD